MRETENGFDEARDFLKAVRPYVEAHREDDQAVKELSRRFDGAERILREALKTQAALDAAIAPPVTDATEAEPVAWRTAVQEACDLLAERCHGNAARSPGHNARLVLEAAIRASAPDPVITPEFEWQWRVSPQHPWTFAISEAEAAACASACNGEYRRTPDLRASAPEPAEAFGMTQGDGWQPIATAPKDGTVFLAVCMEAQTPKSKIAWFETDDRCVTIWKPEKFVCGGPNRWWPTHWRPLPAPPTPTPPEGTRDGEDEMGYTLVYRDQRTGKTVEKFVKSDVKFFVDEEAQANLAPAPGRDVGGTDDVEFLAEGLWIANGHEARSGRAWKDAGQLAMAHHCRKVAEQTWRFALARHAQPAGLDSGTVSEAEVEAAHAQARWWHPYYCTKADIRAVLEVARKATPAPGAKHD